MYDLKVSTAGWIGKGSVSALWKPSLVQTHPGQKASCRCMRSATLWARGMGTKSEMTTLSRHFCVSLHAGHARSKERAGIRFQDYLSESLHLIHYHKYSACLTFNSCWYVCLYLVASLVGTGYSWSRVKSLHEGVWQKCDSYMLNDT